MMDQIVCNFASPLIKQMRPSKSLMEPLGRQHIHSGSTGTTTNQLEGVKVLMHVQPQGPAENSLDGKWFVWACSTFFVTFVFAFNHR